MIPLLVVLLGFGATGCNTRTAHDTPSSEPEADRGEEFVARVYRVEGPYAVRADNSFELGIFDGLGRHNRFARHEVTWQDSVATVVVIGVRSTEPVFCLQDARPPMARARVLTITPPPYDLVEIVFNARTPYEIRRAVTLSGRRPDEPPLQTAPGGGEGS
jgi:hypothetical protein